MKGFSFRLDPVLTLRVWEEERARTIYTQALRQESRFIEALKAVDTRIEESVAQWRREASTQGPAAWIDQGGTLHPLELGKFKLVASANGQLLTADVEVVDKLAAPKRLRRRMPEKPEYVQ